MMKILVVLVVVLVLLSGCLGVEDPKKSVEYKAFCNAKGGKYYGKFYVCIIERKACKIKETFDGLALWCR